MSGIGPPLGRSLTYRLFFHGPSFQVIRSTHLAQQQLIAEFATDLPPLLDHQPPSAVAPRLIELRLQAAGLLSS